MLRAAIGKRTAGTVEERLVDDVFIWFSCSDCEAFKKIGSARQKIFQLCEEQLNERHVFVQNAFYRPALRPD